VHWKSQISTDGPNNKKKTACCHAQMPHGAVSVQTAWIFGSAENAQPENDGQRKLWVWKMQEWKMTDKLLANCEHNYRHE